MEIKHWGLMVLCSLFTILVEALSSLFQKAEGLGLIEGVSVGGDVVPISHVRFADDTILFRSLRQ